MKALLRIISVLTVLVLGVCGHAQNLAETLEKIEAREEGRERYNKILLDELRDTEIPEFIRAQRYYSLFSEDHLTSKSQLDGDECTQVSADLEGIRIMLVATRMASKPGPDQQKYVDMLYGFLGVEALSGENLLLHGRRRWHAGRGKANKEFHECYIYQALQEELEPFVSPHMPMWLKQVRIEDRIWIDINEKTLPELAKYHRLQPQALTMVQKIIARIKAKQDVPPRKVLGLKNEYDQYVQGVMESLKRLQSLHIMVGAGHKMVSLNTIKLFALEIMPAFGQYLACLKESIRICRSILQQTGVLRGSWKKVQAKTAEAGSLEEERASVVVPDDIVSEEVQASTAATVADDQAESVLLTPTHQAAEPSTADEEEPIVTTVISKPTLLPQPQEAGLPDWMADLMGQGRQCDFDYCIKNFKRHFADNKVNILRRNHMVEINFESPRTRGNVSIYCHVSHGAQDDMRWPGWRKNMIAGLEAAGFAK